MLTKADVHPMTQHMELTMNQTCTHVTRACGVRFAMHEQTCERGHNVIPLAILPRISCQAVADTWADLDRTWARYDPFLPIGPMFGSLPTGTDASHAKMHEWVRGYRDISAAPRCHDGAWSGRWCAT